MSIDIHGNKEGGGVCKNCQHNTEGINCEKCKPFFYRPKGVKMTSPDACQRELTPLYRLGKLNLEQNRSNQMPDLQMTQIYFGVVIPEIFSRISRKKAWEP